MRVIRKNASAKYETSSCKNAPSNKRVRNLYLNKITMEISLRFKLIIVGFYAQLFNYI